MVNSAGKRGEEVLGYRVATEKGEPETQLI
jgi:hypothetical protein